MSRKTRKDLRLCLMCGARVTNINKTVKSCSPECQIALDNGLTRERVIKMLTVKI